MVAGPVARHRLAEFGQPDTPVAATAGDVRDLVFGALSLGELTARQSVCRARARLVAWREEVAIVRRESFRDEQYSGTPDRRLGDSAPRSSSAA